MARNRASGQPIVYALSERDGQIRYVGQTRKPMWQRLADHISTANNEDSRPVLRWIFEVYSRGGEVVAHCLEPRAVLGTSEREWIKLFLDCGIDLLNVEHTPAKGRGVSATHAVPANKAKHVAATRAACSTTERSAQLSERFAGVPKSAEHKAAIRNSHLRRLAEVPGALDALSSRANSLAHNEKRIANSAVAHRTPEARAKNSIRMKAVFAARPEIREKIAEAQRKRWARVREAAHANG